MGGSSAVSPGGFELNEETAAAAGSDPASDVPEEDVVSGGMRAALPMMDDAARSPDPSVCPFFRRELDGNLVVPRLEPDDDNRCVAIGAPRPQASRQQELVCLRVAHADCPRYLKGTLVLSEAPPSRRQIAVPRATLAALLVLVLSAGISFGFVVQRGGIDLPVVGGEATPTDLAGVVAPGPSTAASAAPPIVSATPIAEASPTPAPTAAPTPTSTPAPTATPSPSATPPPTGKPAATPTSTRYALLKPCADREKCWIYRVRSGDNLFSIANYFGHSLTTIYSWNPQYPVARLRAGDSIRMPPPTR
ncbi:MAG: LysM peptidoglycan-binding domain-containing protein [Chloroflexi bacterium]|nr:LysM peptidoglycan-binding domain-containing protein [Chloroflexota bacterium]